MATSKSKSKSAKTSRKSSRAAKQTVRKNPRAQFRVPTKKVGGELYFNLINVKGIDPFAVEKALSEMEGIVAPALERVKAARSHANEQDRSAVMNLIAAVTLRNPRQRATIGEIVNQAGQRMLAAGLETRGRYDEYVSAMKAEGTPVGETYEEMKEMVRTTPGTFKATQDFNILIELQSYDRLVRLHEARRWQMLVASDDPPVSSRVTTRFAYAGPMGKIMETCRPDLRYPARKSFFRSHQSWCFVACSRAEGT
jgi:hypothetical protein